MNFKGSLYVPKNVQAEHTDAGQYQVVVVQTYKDEVIINRVNRSAVNYQTSFDCISFVLII